MIFLPCLSPPHPLLHLFFSLSLKAVGLRVIWAVASALRYVGFFVVLARGNLSEDAYLGQASSNIARCGTFIEPVDSSGFLPETWEDLTARAPGQLKRRGS